MASMQDIADKLGVSKGTVSLVLSGKSKNRVSEELRKKVISTAEAMDYHVNEVARSLRTGRTNTIGVIVTDISNEFFGKLSYCIQEQAKKFGYLVLFANSNENDDEMEKLVGNLIQKKVDGIIAVPTENCKKSLQKILDSNIPLVQVDRYVDGIKASFVGVNNYGSSSAGVENLIKSGCRKIGLLGYNLNLSALNERRTGYVDIMKANGLLEEDLIKDINYNRQEEEINEAMRFFLDERSGLNAIYFTSRRVFLTGMKCISKYKLTIPNSLRFLCFDEIEFLLSEGHEIYYIEQPVSKIGTKALDLIMDGINGSPTVGTFLFDASFNTL
jgi:LacI family transcriptional regulator